MTECEKKFQRLQQKVTRKQKQAFLEGYIQAGRDYGFLLCDVPIEELDRDWKTRIVEKFDELLTN